VSRFFETLAIVAAINLAGYGIAKAINRQTLMEACLVGVIKGIDLPKPCIK
jgi:hypothetical protein